MAFSTVLLFLDADVIDPLRLRACAQQRVAVYQRGSDAITSYGACAAEVLVISAPGPPAESYGVELAAYDTTQLATSFYGSRSLFRPISTWQITVTVNIHDRQLLRSYATRRFATCWRPRQAFAGTDEQAVYEALIGSSEGPPPNHYGVRLRRWSASTV